MSSRHHDRIRRLVAWMRQHGHVVAPLVAFHGSTSPMLPDTLPEEIEAARAEGRRIFHIHFVKAEPDPRVTNREGAPVTDSCDRELGCELGGQLTAALPGGEIL